MTLWISSYQRDHRIFSKRKHATTILVVHHCQSSFSGGARRRRRGDGGSVMARRRQFAAAGPILRQRDHKPILRQPQQPQSLARKSGQLSNQVIKHTTIWVCTPLVTKKGLIQVKNYNEGAVVHCKFLPHENYGVPAGKICTIYWKGLYESQRNPIYVCCG